MPCQDPKARSSATSWCASASRATSPCGGRPIHAFFELHIEQGPILEAEDVEIGVVTHGQGQRWYEIKLTGFESHAGSTPMPRRKDALAGRGAHRRARQPTALAHAPLAVGTVGMLNPYPNSRNVIPGDGVPRLRIPPSRRRRALGRWTPP